MLSAIFFTILLNCCSTDVSSSCPTEIQRLFDLIKRRPADMTPESRNPVKGLHIPSGAFSARGIRSFYRMWRPGGRVDLDGNTRQNIALKTFGLGTGTYRYGHQ